MAKPNYEFVRWKVHKSAWEHMRSNTYSIAIVPILKNQRSGKIVTGKTAYRITNVHYYNGEIMSIVADYIANKANETQTTHENADKKKFKEWEKEAVLIDKVKVMYAINRQTQNIL